MSTKKNQLLKMFYETLENPLYKKQFDFILSSLEISGKELVNEFLHYNLYLSDKMGNEVYKSVENRIVLHIHNLVKNSWHIERQSVTLELIKKCNPITMADIGFGVPAKYVKEFILAEPEKKLVFCDIFDSAFRFSDVLLTIWDQNWNKRISYKKTDMNALEYVGDFDLYLLQDAIEHTKDPSAYLKKHVSLSPKNAVFIISLPIGPLFPRHFLAWENDLSAIKWLEDCGLTIETFTSVYVNPEVDLFADQLDPNYHDLYALCHKKINHEENT